MNVFLTGTDTGVGKTYVASLLVRGLRRAGMDTVPMKPICCGDRADAEALFEACEHEVPLNVINPLWYRTPAAPYAASIVENRPADLTLIRATFERLRFRHRSLVVEGVGGWLVPISRDYFVADLAAELGLPVAVVVRNRLGAISHALLTVRDIERRGIPFAGIILNNIDSTPDSGAVTNRTMLEDLLNRPLLLEIASGQQTLSLAVA